MSRSTIAAGLLMAVVAASVPAARARGDFAPRIDAVDTARPVPSTVNGEVWRTVLPEEASHVAAGGPGMFAVQSDGVVAIDETTGDIVWQYRSVAAEALAIVASPDAPSALLVTSTEGELEIVGLDAATGVDSFELPFTQPDFGYAGFHIGVTNDAFVLHTDQISVRGFGLGTGQELWVTPMPEICSSIIAWFGNYQSTPSGVVVPCAGSGRGGFAFLDTRLGEFTWTDVRADLIGNTLSEPEVSRDGTTVHVRFLDRGSGGGFVNASAILDVESGRSLTEADLFVGQLGVDGTFLDTHGAFESGTVRLENLRSGDTSTIEQPCTVADPLVVSSTGVLWLKSLLVIGEEVGDDPCQFVFTPAQGDPTRFNVDFDFRRKPRVVVGAGTIMLTEGSTVIGLR